MIALLDDPDERVAVVAMSELLFREAELGDVLATLQESTDPLLRRRSHQLQAAITLRQRRKHFLDVIYDENVSWPDGLIEVHLQWFDNDSRPDLEELWTRFRRDFGSFETLEELVYGFRRAGIQALPESTLTPESYCLGTVIEQHCGAPSLVCAMGMALAEQGKPELYQLVRVLGEFALRDRAGRLFFPGRGFQIENKPGPVNVERWDARALLNYALLQLMAYAVNSDSFRYIQTIGQALSGAEDGEPLDFLPYPYFPPFEDDDNVQEKTSCDTPK